MLAAPLTTIATPATSSTGGAARGKRMKTADATTSASALVIVDTKALALVVASAVFILFPLAAPPVDDVAGVAIVVNGAASIRGLALASLCPIPATRLPA